MPVVASITKLARDRDRDRRHRQRGGRGGRAPRSRRTAGRCSSTSRSTSCSRSGSADVPDVPCARRRRARPRRRRARGRAASRGAERPALIAGSDVCWDGAWDALRAVRRVAAGARRSSTAWAAGACRPTTSSRSRARAGCCKPTPTWWSWSARRSTSGCRSAGSATRRSCTSSTRPRQPRRPRAGRGVARRRPRDHPRRHGRATAASARDHEPWIAQLRDAGVGRRPAERAAARGRRRPDQADARLRRAARVGSTATRWSSCDGGDFVSYAGKYVDSYEPGCWLDPGPYGCLGTGLGYAIAARVAHPDRQVVLHARRRRRRLLAAWTSTRSCATGCRSSSSSATTASGASRSTRCRRSTATTWPPTCSRAAATTTSCEALGGAGETVDAPRRPRSRPRPRLRRGRALRRQRPHRPRRRLPAHLQPRLTMPRTCRRLSTYAVDSCDKIVGWGWRSAGLVEEALDVDDDPGDAGRRRQAALVVDARR